MLSKTAEYVLRNVTCLDGDAGRSESADSLCEQTKVPRRDLYKVLQDLVHPQLVHSRSGPGGGYSLSHSPDDITIPNVLNQVAPLERMKHCPLVLPSRVRLCALHQ